MARGVVALCIGGLLTVSAVGFSLPGGGLLCDRDLDALVGGTDSAWCWKSCTNCNEDIACTDDKGCFIPGIRCPDIEYAKFAAEPEICDKTIGNETCQEWEALYLLCYHDAECWCYQDSPGGKVYCAFALETLAAATTTEFTDSLVCTYVETSFDPYSEACVR